MDQVIGVGDTGSQITDVHRELAVDLYGSALGSQTIAAFLVRRLQCPVFPSQTVVDVASQSATVCSCCRRWHGGLALLTLPCKRLVGPLILGTSGVLTAVGLFKCFRVINHRFGLRSEVTPSGLSA